MDRLEKLISEGLEPQYQEFRRVIEFTPAHLTDEFRVPDRTCVMLTRIPVGRNGTELAVLARMQLTIYRGAKPGVVALSADLRALYEVPKLDARPFFREAYAVRVHLEADDDACRAACWPISVQLIGLQG